MPGIRMIAMQPSVACPMVRRQWQDAMFITESAMFPDVSRLPTLATGRLRLRELGTRDVDALYAVFSDAEVMRYWSRPAFATRDEAVEYLEHIHRGRAQRRLWQWGIATSDDDVVIGTCTLFANDG